MTPNDENLSWSTIGRAAAGDGDARSRFGRTYLPVVRSFLAARWRGTPLIAEVDDAVQEVFVECLRPDGALSRAEPGQGDFGALLFGVSRNVAARFEERANKRARRDHGVGSVIDAIPADDPTLSMMFDREWARAMVNLAGERMREAAASGPPEARQRVELLQLRFAGAMPIRDIAREWDVDPDSLHRAYGKARDEFRAHLRRVLAEHSARTEADLDAEATRLLQLLK